MWNMALNNAHPHFHPNLTGNALRVYAQGYGNRLELPVFKLQITTLVDRNLGLTKKTPISVYETENESS